MANKVLSIKMDENDIERLKMYYAALTKAGFLSSKTLSLNAFYKHLLLDYLNEDARRAFNMYSHYGVLPKYIRPEAINNNENFNLINTYNLNPELFELYTKYVKEVLQKRVEIITEAAELFNKTVKADIAVADGELYEMKYNSLMNTEEDTTSFWEKKALELQDLQENLTESVDEEIEMINKSSLLPEEKQALIEGMKEFEKKKKQNYNIMYGRGIRN